MEKDEMGMDYLTEGLIEKKITKMTRGPNGQWPNW